MPCRAIRVQSSHVYVSTHHLRSLGICNALHSIVDDTRALDCLLSTRLRMPWINGALRTKGMLLVDCILPFWKIKMMWLLDGYKSGGSKD
jgi:hypothetical protein